MASKSFKDTLLRGIALIGLIVILVLGAWGIILLAFNLPSFLGGVSESVRELFTRDIREEEVEEEVREPEAPVVVSPSRPTTPTIPTTPSQPSQPASVYTPAAVAAPQLYGLPDLRVSILSVVPSGNRYVMQFMVENAGTNVAWNGWSFNAILPINSSYTYVAPSQRALYPGDKMLYTMTFDRTTHNYRYNDDRHGYYYPISGNRRITLILDPQNRVRETNKYNNSVSWNLNVW